MDSLHEERALLTAPACLAKEDYFRQHHLWKCWALEATNMCNLIYYQNNK